MARLKAMAPLGIFLFPALLSTIVIVIVILATAAPATFCAELEPNRSIKMDSMGGEFRRVIFLHCRAGCDVHFRAYGHFTAIPDCAGMAKTVAGLR